MKKTYILKNKDVDVLEFNVCFEKEMFRGFEKEMAYLLDVKVLRQDMVPYEIKKSSQNIKESLENWIRNRKIPKNREFVNEILASSGITREDNFMAYIIYLLGFLLMIVIGWYQVSKIINGLIIIYIAILLMKHLH